jgi:circadian clock protein KaiC
MHDTEPRRVPSGIPGLDELLQGGLLPERTYMIRGTSGTGKTIVGYHFLTAAAPDETALYVAFEETAADLKANAESLGFDLSGVEVLDMSPSPEQFLAEETYTVFGPGEVEGQSMATEVGEAVEEHDPTRVFIDPLTQLRHLSPDDHQFNRTAASLMSYLKQQGATTLFTSQPTKERSDDDLQYLCDGSVTLTRGEHGRTIAVDKFRGSGFRGGSHALRIDAGRGMSVFPKLDPGAHAGTFSTEQLSTGIDELDDLLGGGIERGTVTLVSGPSGVGKSTTGTAFARAAAQRGERAALYLFEESVEGLQHRAASIGAPVGELIESGDLHMEAIEPLTISADEFAQQVREEVETNDTELVMLDGTAGYRVALREDENKLQEELHSLCRYLRNVGVTVILTDEVRDVTGAFRPSNSQVSYLADNILFLRYIEVDGEIRKSIGVLKKRLGAFESTLRSFRISDDGLHVGEPLTGLRGVLTGTPTSAGGETGRAPDEDR